MPKKGWFASFFGSSEESVKKKGKKAKRAKRATKLAKAPKASKMLAINPGEMKAIEDSIRETINWLYVLNETELNNQKRIEDDALLELKKRLLDISKRIGALAGPVI